MRVMLPCSRWMILPRTTVSPLLTRRSVRKLRVSRIAPPKERFARANVGGFGANLKGDFLGVIDVRSHFQNDANVLVREGLVQPADIRAQAVLDERHLRADEQAAELVIRDIDLRLRQNARAGVTCAGIE